MENTKKLRDIGKTFNRYELVILASKRARQINDFFTSLHRQEGLPQNIVAPSMDSLNKKPLTVALEEIREGKVDVRRPQREKSQS